MISLRIRLTSIILPSFAMTTSYFVRNSLTSFFVYGFLLRNPIDITQSQSIFSTILVSSRISPIRRIFLRGLINSLSNLRYFPKAHTLMRRSAIFLSSLMTNSCPMMPNLGYSSKSIICDKIVAITSDKPPETTYR